MDAVDEDRQQVHVGSIIIDLKHIFAVPLIASAASSNGVGVVLLASVKSTLSGLSLACAVPEARSRIMHPITSPRRQYTHARHKHLTFASLLAPLATLATLAPLALSPSLQQEVSVQHLTITVLISLLTVLYLEDPLSRCFPFTYVSFAGPDLRQ